MSAPVDLTTAVTMHIAQTHLVATTVPAMTATMEMDTTVVSSTHKMLPSI